MYKRQVQYDVESGTLGEEILTVGEDERIAGVAWDAVDQRYVRFVQGQVITCCLLYTSAGSGYLERGAEKIYSVLYFSTPMISAFYCSDDYMNISLTNVFKKKEVVFENVPLCGFDKVYEIVEKYVDEGKIKRVYNICLLYTSRCV